MDPIMIRSGRRRSSTAVPSARNSGLDRTSNRTPGFALADSLFIVRFRELQPLKLLTISLIDSAVLQGTVDFSITILWAVATLAMARVAAST